MKTQHHVLALFLSLCWFRSLGADDSFFLRYVGLLNTNDTRPIAVHSTSVVDTSNTAPKLESIEISLDKLRSAGEVGDIRLGMTMDQVVLHWGKPKSLYANCGPGPRFIYADVTLNFTSNALDRIYLPESARFTSGLRADSKLGDWVRVLGEPTMRNNRSGISLAYETKATIRTVLLLSFDSDGNPRSCPTPWRDPALTNWFRVSAP